WFFLGGGPPRARPAVKSRIRNAANARYLYRLRRQRCSDSGDSRKEVGRREIRGRGRDVFNRRHDGRWQSAAIRDFTFPGAKLFAGVRSALSRSIRAAAALLDNLLGTFDEGDWSDHHGTRRRPGVGAATQARALSGSDRADLQ